MAVNSTSAISNKILRNDPLRHTPERDGDEPLVSLLPHRYTCAIVLVVMMCNQLSAYLNLSLNDITFLVLEIVNSLSLCLPSASIMCSFT